MPIRTHKPNWKPGDLRIDDAGNTMPGFVCVHELENGNGPCGGNVLSPDEEIADHACFVSDAGAVCPICGQDGGFHTDEPANCGYAGHAAARRAVCADLTWTPRAKGHLAHE